MNLCHAKIVHPLGLLVLFAIVLQPCALLGQNGSGQKERDASNEIAELEHQLAVARKLAADKQAIAERCVVSKYEAAAREGWEKSIQELELLDQTERHPDDAILFAGSSSIRLWESIEEDMAPYHPIRRGYGGARFSDLAVFADRLIRPHPCRAIVIFVANDVSGVPYDHSPEEVGLLVQNILRTIRETKKTTPVFLIEVTPTRRRFKHWQTIRQVNASIREICLTTPHTYFVATAEHYLDSQKQPIEELFVEDLLHLNEAGYDLWASLVKRRLDGVLGSQPTPSAE